MHNMRSLGTLTLVAVALAACATVGRKIDTANVEKIEKGKTTRNDVLGLLGSPDQITQDGRGGVAFSYHYTRATAKPQNFIPIVGPFVGGTNVQNQMVMVFIGPDDIVRNVISNSGATDSSRLLSTGSKPQVEELEHNKRPNN